MHPCQAWVELAAGNYCFGTSDVPSLVSLRQIKLLSKILVDKKSLERYLVYI